MSIIKCSYCGSTDVEYKEYYGTYTCSGCDRILDSDEVIIEDDKQEEFEEDSPSVSIKEEHGVLTSIAILLLSILSIIPIIDIIVAMLLNAADTKEEYKKVFSYRALVNWLVFSIVALTLIIGFIEYKSVLRVNIHLNRISAILEDIISVDDEVDFSVPKGIDLLQALVNREDGSVDEVVLSAEWYYIDEAILPGKSIEVLIDSAGDNYIWLFQTKQFKDRYGTYMYFNLGNVINGAGFYGPSDKYAIEYNNVPEFVSVYTDDYGEPVHYTLDDIYKKKYIYYLDFNKSYRVNVLYDESQTIAGFMLTEMEAIK